MILLVCVIAVTFFAFSPSLKNGFTNWDDQVYVTGSPFIKDISFQSIKEIFTSEYSSNYIPLTIISYSLEYKFFGSDPRAYHATNLLLHLLNCALVFWLVFLISGKNSVSFIAALLFGIHPMHVEPVAWVSERKDVLYAFFFLGSLIYYLNYRRTGLLKYYYLCAGAFLLSLLSKPMAVTLPFVLLALDYLQAREFRAKELTAKTPFFLMALLSGILTLSIQRAGGVIREGFSLNPAQLIKTFFVTSYELVFYLYKLFLPVKLSCLYPYPEKAGLVFWAAPVLLALLASAVMLSARYTKKIVFGSLFFLICISPVLQFVPIGHAIAADRYTYVPYIGLFYLAGELFHKLYAGKLKYFALIAVAGVASVSAFISYNRCQVWKDSATLWNDVIRKYPGVSTAYNNLAVFYSQQENYPEAMRLFNKALEINPKDPETHSNLGNLYFILKDHGNAALMYRRLLEIKPDEATAYRNLGRIYSAEKDYAGAAESYRKALAIDPLYADAHFELGSLYDDLRQYDKALAEYSAALKADPGHYLTHYNLGIYYYLRKDYGKALAEFEYLGRSNPRDTDLKNKVAILKNLTATTGAHGDTR